MNDTGDGAGDLGEDFDNRGREDVIDIYDRLSESASSSRPHNEEVFVGESGVECLLPLMFRYSVSSGGGHIPLSLGCNGFEIGEICRWPARTLGERSDCCKGKSGPGV